MSFPRAIPSIVESKVSLHFKGELARKNKLPLKNSPAFEKSNGIFDASHSDSVRRNGV